MEYLCYVPRSSIVYYYMQRNVSLNDFNNAIVCVTGVGSENEANVTAFSPFRMCSTDGSIFMLCPTASFLLPCSTSLGLDTSTVP